MYCHTSIQDSGPPIGTDDETVSDVGLLLILVDCVDNGLFSDISKRKSNNNE